MGVGEGVVPLVVLVDDPGNGEGDGVEEGERAAATAVEGLVEPVETLGAYDPERVCEFFDIGGAEREATDADVEALVLERVALLIVER
jgi:KEOPS complex subunit Cgi121